MNILLKNEGASKNFLKVCNVFTVFPMWKHHINISKVILNKADVQRI